MEIDFGALIAILTVCGITAIIISIAFQIETHHQNSLKEYFEKKGYKYLDNLERNLVLYETNNEQLEDRNDRLIGEFIKEDISYYKISKILNRVKEFDLINFYSNAFITFGYFKEENDILIGLINFNYNHNGNRGANYFGYCPCIICAINIKYRKFPTFSLRQKRFLIDNLFYNNIDFKEDSFFSSRFMLEGKEKNEIINFFNANNRRVFIKYHKRGFYYKAQNDTFIVYRYNFNCDLNVKMRDELLDTALSIYNELTFGS